MKRLEELEIGRPSTWASIIQTIQDRGYVWKKGQALVPTWTAFAVVGLLEQHFTDLVDYELTAKMDDDLDEIANGRQQKDKWLQRFYFGDDAPAARPEADRRGEPRQDRRRRDQHVPARPRRERRADRRQARQVRPVRQARRRHRQRPRGPAARRARRRQGDRAARAAQERRADRRARRLSGVRQERALRAVRAVGRARQPATGAREAEDVEPVPDDDARPHHGRRSRAVAAAAALARPGPGRRQGDRRQQRALRAVRREGEGLPLDRLRGAAAHDHARRGVEDLPAARRCSSVAAATWPPRARCASSAPTR